MALVFKWDKRKAQSNKQKHDVTFEEASTVFGDALSITVMDTVHSTSTEDRFTTIGASARHRLLVIVHVDQGDTIRIISARKPTRAENKQYEDG
jgi:uncharacterized DUF497 family protein